MAHKLTLALLLLQPLVCNAMDWQDWWQRPDTLANEYFASGEYAKAADKYTDDKWQAVAKYKAGDYAKAAEILADDETAAGLYNKAGALAQSGKLQQAIAAYQQSLAINPDNEDAKFNKKIVETALKNQKKQPGKGKGDDKQDKQQKQDQQGDNQDPQKGDGEAGDQQSIGDPQNGENQKDSDQPKDGEPNSKDPSPEEDEASTSKEDEADLAKNPQAAQQKKAAARAAAKAAAEDNANAEKEQANQQWLQRIPDDPSGLLRRKFAQQYKKQRHATPKKNW